MELKGVSDWRRFSILAVRLRCVVLGFETVFEWVHKCGALLWLPVLSLPS